jgi:MFS family permease
MVFVGLTSLAVMIFMGMANTLMQTRTPDALRGRVLSVQTMVFIGFMPLGQLVLGSVGTLVGINNAFLLGGVIVTLLAGYAALRVTALREPVSTAPPRPATTS